MNSKMPGNNETAEPPYEYVPVEELQPGDISPRNGGMTLHRVDYDATTKRYMAVWSSGDGWTLPAGHLVEVDRSAVDRLADEVRDARVLYAWARVDDAGGRSSKRRLVVPVAAIGRDFGVTVGLVYQALNDAEGYRGVVWNPHRKECGTFDSVSEAERAVDAELRRTGWLLSSRPVSLVQDS